MSKMHDTAKLDDLIVTTIDSVRGYEYSAEHAEAGRHATFFAEMAEERLAVVDRLQRASHALGGTPADYGSVAGTVHRRIEALRRVLGGDDAALLSEIERGEDYLKEEFERALDDAHVSDATRDIIRDCYASVRRGHDRARALREIERAA
ncbi:PA2169 family four-helix-bundle protein [Sphingosinithalassobacter sp. CS137]|uniref:PA2169 family four-helix-bundle protein n=1 Tax=Sphingosinithalassobacter sp. CS137 TaxID=2762748 RepID=UPI00165E36CD|nr:PA2169 family four-helix-bundle protein [Sphingosinithalassobacter sp. CS137]